VDLRYAISCDAVNDKEFRVRTNQRTVVLSAPSVPSREEWVKAIRKVIFKAQNMGDSVKIAIPYSTILDVEKSTAMDFSETIEVKVFDKEEHFSVDSYFFAYFHDLASALDQIRDAVRAHRVQPERSSPQMVMDTTVSRPAPSLPDRVQSLPNPEHAKASSSFSISSFLRPFHDTMSLGRPSVSSISPTPESEGFTHVSRRPNSSSFVPVTTPEQLDTLPSQDSTTTPNSLTPTAPEHTYPPSPSVYRNDPDHPLIRESSGSAWSVGVPSWLRGPRRVFGGSSDSAASLPPASTSSRVREVYSSTLSALPPGSRASGFGDLAFSVLETPDVPIDPEMTEKFRTVFAYDEKETLLGCEGFSCAVSRSFTQFVSVTDFPGYIYRLLPVPGRLYISTNFFCFKSTGPLTAKTRVSVSALPYVLM
jgi:sterol 3beta-glucosyltransferase